MKVRSIKCNPELSISDGEVVLYLNDIEVNTVIKAIEEYVKARPDVMSFAHISKTVAEWRALGPLINYGALAPHGNDVWGNQLIEEGE